MKLAAIVTIYNQDKGLLHNVLSYIEYVDRLLIFDNNSNPINDETNFATLKDNPKVEYVSFNENKGISVALNYALSRYHDYDYILTMDQDSYFEKNEFKKYINYVSNCDSIMSSRTAIFAPSLSVSQDSPLIDFPWRVITSGNIVNVKIAQSIGGYDEKLFIDEVDHDFCFSIKENGYDIVRLNFVHMKHHLGAYKTYNIMGRKVHTTNHSEIRRYYMIRNSLYVIKKHPYNALIRFNYPKKILFMFLAILLLEEHKKNKIHAMIWGIIDFFTNNMGKCKMNRC